jgi:transcriptional regulator with XRE-family HTH domain
MIKRSTAEEGKSPLKILREQAGLSQEQLARQVNVSVKTISNWERGVYPAMMTVPQVKALCKSLNVTLEELPDDFGPSNRED